MTKKLLLLLLALTSQSFAARVLTSLAIITGEKEKITEITPGGPWSIKSDVPEGAATLILEQQAAPLLVNASLAHFLLVNKLKAHVDFANVDLADWHIYSVNADSPTLNPLVLFVPTSYSERLKELLGPSVGFNTAALKKYESTPAGIEMLLKELRDDLPVETAPYADAIKNVFDTHAQTNWTLFFNGHGRESLASPEKTPIVNILKTTTPSVPGARIADIPLNEFLKLIMFMEENLTIHLLFIDTCAGPGYHTEAIRQVLNIAHKATPDNPQPAIAVCGAEAETFTPASSTRSFKTFFDVAAKTDVSNAEKISEALVTVCELQASLIKPRSFMTSSVLTIPNKFTPTSHIPGRAPAPDKEYTERGAVLQLTSNTIHTPIVIGPLGAALELDVPDSAHFSFNSFILSDPTQAPDTFIVNTLISPAYPNYSMREFRRLRGETAHPITITAQHIISERLTYEFVTAIRYPAQLPYNGIFFYAQKEADGFYTITQRVVGQPVLRDIETKITRITAVDLPHVSNDLYLQAMANEYLQELAAFGRVNEITILLDAIRESSRTKPAIMTSADTQKRFDMSRKALALMEKRNILPYTLPDQFGIRLAFTAAVIQGELSASRKLFDALIIDQKRVAQDLGLLINDLLVLSTSTDREALRFPKNQLKKPGEYEAIVIFLTEKLMAVSELTEKLTASKKG
jgi:hypothetical protein